MSDGVLRPIAFVPTTSLAGRLVLAPRSTRLLAAEPPPVNNDNDSSFDPVDADSPADHDPGEDSVDPGVPEPRDDAAGGDEREEETAEQGDQELNEVVLAAAQAAIPAGLLIQLKSEDGGRSRARSSGKAGALQRSGSRGRPTGVRRGEPRTGVRLNVLETLRAAAPWQLLRRREAGELTPGGRAQGGRAARIEVRREDFHVTRFKQRAGTTTIFVVDASGSSALHRLAEAKGAVELLLADCYVRRDRVAVIAFRGQGAELVAGPGQAQPRQLTRGWRYSVGGGD